MLGDIELMFGIWVYNDELQIKFTFRSSPMIFCRVMALGLLNVANICLLNIYGGDIRVVLTHLVFLLFFYEKWSHPFFMKCRHLSMLFLYIPFSFIRFSPLYSEGKPPVISTFANYRLKVRSVNTSVNFGVKYNRLKRMWRVLSPFTLRTTFIGVFQIYIRRAL